MLYCSLSGKDNSAHVAALLQRLTQAWAQREEKLPPRSLLHGSITQARWWSADVVSAKRSKLSWSTFSVCSNKPSPRSKTHWAWVRSWHQGKRNKMCSCGVGSISEADAEKRQMRWQARREESWGQLNPQNWQYVIYRHYCTEGLQQQPFSISELNSHDSGRCCS